MTTLAIFASAPFTAPTHAGESISVEVEGFTITATLHRDDDATPPWEREDGHGEVSDWTSRDKAPGELILSSDRNSKRFYDFAGACEIARRDGWGVEGGRLEGESARAYAARAARHDYEVMRTWCADLWEYVGVSVTVEREGVRLVDDYAHAVWGIESTAAEYLTETADGLAVDALEDARAKIATLAESI